MYSRNLPKLWKKNPINPIKKKVTNLYSNVTLDQRLLLKAFSVIYPNDILYTKLSTKKATSYIVKYYQTKGLSYQEWAYFWILFLGKIGFTHSEFSKQNFIRWFLPKPLTFWCQSTYGIVNPRHYRDFFKDP